MRRIVLSLPILAAALGFAPLGALADYDEGLRAYRIRDYTVALREFKVAGERGHAEAQYYLGNMYVRGMGVNQNDKEAMRWFSAAADQGNAASQFNVGLMLMEGRGQRKDLERAYYWFILAANGNAPDIASLAAKNRDVVKSRLTPQQVEDAEALVKIWRPRR